MRLDRLGNSAAAAVAAAAVAPPPRVGGMDDGWMDGWMMDG